MTFSPAPLDADNTLCIQAWANESNTWRVEVNRVMFGYRVQVRRNEQGSNYAVDYCAGNNVEWVEALATVVMSILRLRPDTINDAQLHASFPPYAVRPMARDIVCWSVLCDMAGIEPDRPIYEVGDVTFNHRQAHRVQNYLLLCMGGMDADQARQLLGMVSSPSASPNPDPHAHVDVFP